MDVPVADYRIQRLPWWPQSPTALSSPRGRVLNPLHGGISISNAFTFGYATLGGKVIDRANGDEMILSNWHVLVGSWTVPPDVAIYQPGQGHGGRPENTVAHLSRHAMDEYIDAAVAKLTGTRQLLNDQLDLGPVTGVTAPMPEMRVVKSGCASKVTAGRITGIEGRRIEYYDGVWQVIRNIVHIAQLPEGGELSRQGDSGSWWLEAGTNRAVALHFAGSNFPEYALAVAMPQVLEALQVDIR